MVSFEWNDFIKIGNVSDWADFDPYNFNLSLKQDNDTVLLIEATGDDLWKAAISNLLTWTEVLTGITSDDFFLSEVGSGNTWVLYDIDANPHSHLKESNDYGDSWSGDQPLEDYYVMNLFVIGTDIFTISFDDRPSAALNIAVHKWNAGGPTWDIQDDLGYTLNAPPWRGWQTGFVIGNNYYFIIDENGGAGFYKYDHSITTITRIAGPIATGLFCMAETNYRTICLLKGDATTFFATLYHGIDGTTHLYKTTDTGANWTESHQIDTTGGNLYFFPQDYYGVGEAPWALYNTDIGVDILKYDITTDHFYKIFGIPASTTRGCETVNPYTFYFFQSAANGDVYQYKESLADFKVAAGTCRAWNVPLGNFSHQKQLSPDQLIEIYEFDDPDYVLAFRGKLGRPEYIHENKTFNYICENLGWGDLEEEVSYDAVAENISAVVITLIGKLTDPYIWLDATSVPNIAIPMTYNFNQIKLRDCLYVCAILANGYWWTEPNGYTYFRVYGDSPASGDAFSYANKNMTIPNLDILQVSHNDFHNIRGGMDLANGRPFIPTTGTATIPEHIQQYGKQLWRGKKIFSGARTQTSLDAIITALKIWEGMVTNPIAVTFNAKDKFYYPVGYESTLTFEHNEALNFVPAKDVITIESYMDFKRIGYTRIIVSNNITRLI